MRHYHFHDVLWNIYGRAISFSLPLWAVDYVKISPLLNEMVDVDIIYDATFSLFSSWLEANIDDIIFRPPLTFHYAAHFVKYAIVSRWKMSRIIVDYYAAIDGDIEDYDDIFDDIETFDASTQADVYRWFQTLFQSFRWVIYEPFAVIDEMTMTPMWKWWHDIFTSFVSFSADDGWFS